jgi:hypothetical protein
LADAGAPNTLVKAGDEPRTDDALSPPYFWEKKRFGHAMRGAESAHACVKVMLERIGLSKDQRRSLLSDAATRKRLLAYGVEVHLNIAWYDRAKNREGWKRAALMTLIVLIAAGGLAATVVYGLLHALFGKSASAAPEGSNATVFQISAFVGAGFAILRFVSSLASNQCRIGLFWRARSDIAEVLYLFEQKWQGQFSMARLSELYADLDAGITAARHIARTERQQFFDSLISPNDALSSAQQAFGSVFGQVQNLPVRRDTAQVVALPAPAVPVRPLTPAAPVAPVAPAAPAADEVPPPPAADPALSTLLAAAEQARQKVLRVEGVVSARVQFTPRGDAAHPGVEVRVKIDQPGREVPPSISVELPDKTQMSIPIAVEHAPA